MKLIIVKSDMVFSDNSTINIYIIIVTSNFLVQKWENSIDVTINLAENFIDNMKINKNSKHNTTFVQ